MNIEPLGKYIIVKITSLSTKGISRGEVVAVSVHGNSLMINKKVLFDKYTGLTFEFENENYLLIEDNKILAIEN